MTTETADLRFTADSSDLKEVTSDLGKINSTAPKTEAAVDDLTKSFKENATAAEKDKIALDAAIKQYNRTSKSVPKATSSLGRMTQAFKVQKNATQVASYQVQDFAVQVGSGQSAMTAFTQQAPQFFGVFGAGGAVLGTIVAITAAVAGPFITSLFDAEDSVDLLDTAIDTLDETLKVSKDGLYDFNEELIRLEGISKSAAAAQLAEAMFTATDAIEIARESIVDLILDQDGLSSGFVPIVRAFNNGKISARQLTDSYNNLFLSMKDGGGKDFREFRSELEGITRNAESAEKRLERIREAIEGGGASSVSSFGDRSDSGRSESQLADRLAREENLIQASAEKKFYSLQDSTRSQTQVIQDSFNERLAFVRSFGRRNVDYLDEAAQLEIDLERDKSEKIDAILQKDMARKHAIADQEEALNERKKASMMSFFSSSLSILANGLREGTILQKAAFLADKAIAVADIIVNTEKGAGKALAYGPVLGPPLSLGVKTLGYASAGVVAGQAIASFEGGGMTPAGARSGGMDGKGGMLAMLHPNEKVTDLTRGGGDGVTLVTNIKVEGGTGNEVVTNNKSTDNQGRIIQDIVIRMANDKSSGMMKGIFNNTTAQPKGNR